MKAISFFSFALTLFLFSNSNAQDAKKKSYLLEDGSRINETVVNNVKEGFSETINPSGVVLSRGNYKNDFRVGNWFFFTNKDSLFLKYNYDTQKILFLDQSKILFANVDIETKDQNVKKNASIPVPIISIDQYLALLANVAEHQVPFGVETEAKDFKVEIVAFVNKDGKASYSMNYKLNNKEVSKKIEKLDNKIEVDWLPAHFDSKNLNSKFSVTLVYDNSKKDDKKTAHRRFNWN